MWPSCKAGSRCRKRRTVVKFTVSGGRDRAARPPFEDPRASSTVPRRFWKGSQRRSFWGQDIGQFWYTFWVTFGLLSGPSRLAANIQDPLREGCFLGLSGRTRSGRSGKRKRVTVVKFTAQRCPNPVPKRDPSGDTFREDLVLPAPCGDPLQEHTLGAAIGHRFGDHFGTRAETQFGRLVAPRGR